MGAEVISVDSMQVYRGMDIGTAKPSTRQRAEVPHHMIDIVDPEDSFSVAEFRIMARRVLAGVGGPALIVGGSGLHFRAVVDPMSFAPTDPALRSDLEALPLGELTSELLAADPEAGGLVDLANTRRVVRAVEVLRLTGESPTVRAERDEGERVRRYVPEIEFTAVGLDPAGLLKTRVAGRVEGMRRRGLVEEVRGLLGRLGRTAASAVGYREVAAGLRGEISIDEAFSVVERNTMALARRQRTWFQRDPRIRWIPWVDDVTERVTRTLEALR